MKQLMYMGPSIPGIVKSTTVFIGGLPKDLTMVAEKVPAVNKLLVPVDRITETTKSLSERGSVENVSYNSILKYLEGEKK